MLTAKYALFRALAQELHSRLIPRIRVHNETLSVAAMRVCNPDCSPPSIGIRLVLLSGIAQRLHLLLTLHSRQLLSYSFLLLATRSASLILILWVRLKSVAAAEFARLNTGARITRGNSENGALLTREIRARREQNNGPNEALTVVAMCICNPDRSPVGINR